MILRSSRTLTARKVISSKAPVNAVRLNAALSRTYRGGGLLLDRLFLESVRAYKPLSHRGGGMRVR